MKQILIVLVIVIIGMFNTANAIYTPPNYYDVDLELEPSYTAPNYWDVDLVLNEVSGLVISIVHPTNTTYDTTSIDLNWTNSTETSWVGYSLNGASNVTLTTDIIMTATEGSNHVIVWGNDTSGTMTSDEEWFTVVTSPPVINNLNDNDGIYVKNKNWVMWANVTDENTNIDTVFLEIGGVNYTCTNNTASNYTYTISDLGVAEHSYYFYANNSYGYIAKSSEGTLSITQVSTSIKVYLNGTDGSATIVQGDVNITVVLDIADKTVSYYKNSSLMQSATTPLENISSWMSYEDYNISGIFNGDTNYSASQTDVVLTISDTLGPTIIIDSPTNTTYNTKTVWFNVTTYDIAGIDWCGYSLDDGDNITMTNSSGNWNAVNTSMWDQYHTVTFYCNDSYGNMGSTSIRGFTSQYENVTRCTTLDVEGRHYYLRNNIIDSSIDDCIEITADHIIFDGMGYTVDGNDVANRGIYVKTSATVNYTIKNCNISDWATAGVHINRFSNGYGDILDVTISSCPNAGLYLANSILLHTVTNSTFTDNEYGIYLDGDENNILSNLTIKNNDYGIRFSMNADNNNMTNTIFENNTISFYYDGLIPAQCPVGNKLYNNLFNDTTYWGNSGCSSPLLNLNTTKQLGTRIYSTGVEIGGNYWTNPTSTGYSDTCTDTNKDGFCDTPYTIATGVYDYLPYSNEYGYYIELYLNGTSADRYYEQGTYANLTGKKVDYLGNVQVSNIWLDIDILGYGTNYTTSATGIVNYDFLTHAVNNEIVVYENDSCSGWTLLANIFYYSGCYWQFGGTGSTLYKNSDFDTIWFDILYCNSNHPDGRVLLYSGGVLKYNETCSVKDNIEVSLGTFGIDRTINITLEEFSLSPTYTIDTYLGNMRFFNIGGVSSYSFNGTGRTEEMFGWNLNVYDDINSVEFNLTGILSNSSIIDDNADSYVCNGTFIPTAKCYRGVDGNWITYTILTNNTYGDIQETWNIPYGLVSANFTSKYWMRSNCQGSTEPQMCWNSSGEWENISLGHSTTSISTRTGIIPTSCLTGSEFKIKTCLDGHDEPGIPFGRYHESRVEWVVGYPNNITIDMNRNGLDKQYPLSYLIGENEFYTNKISTNEIKTNLTFDTAESNIFYVSFPTDGFDYECGTFNLTGYPFTVSQQSSLYDNYTSNFSIKNIDSNVWIYDINTTGIILSGTLLKFPHYITEEGGNVHPVKIYNITDTADEDSVILVTGEKWGGNSSLRQSPYNSSEIEWTPHLTLPDNSIFRIVIGKNVTWENDTTVKEIAINLTTTVPHLYMNLESTHLQSNTTQDTDSCSTTTSCIYTCCGTPCLYDSCYFGNWANYCAGTSNGYAKDCNDNMGDCDGGEVTAYLNYIFYDYNTISDIAFNYSYYTYGYSLDIDFYYYNKYVLGYEHIFNKNFGGWYKPTQTTISSYTDADEYISATGEFKVKQIMTDHGSGYESDFWKPYIIYNRSVYNPEVNLFSTIIWYYNGLMDSNDDTDTSDDLSGYINSYDESDFLFNFTSDGRYGEMLIYFEPFWTSSPENITVQVGDSTDYIYQNTTVFNTTEEINISMVDEINNYIRSNCEDEVSCDVPFRISSAKAGVLEVSNINFSYSYNTIVLDPTDVTSGTPVIDLVFYDGAITIDDLNVTYYGSKNITVTAHNADYSINDTHDIKVVFSNFSMAYPYTFMDFLYWAPYTNNIQNVEPVSQSSTRPGITFTSLAYDQKFDIYMKTDNQLYCINTSIYTARTVANEVYITNTSYTKVINDINIRTDTPDYNETWLWRDYNNCDGILYRYYEPNITIYGKCTECV